eukprot:jgi/Ulvmu1/10872/UM007_0048.1
MPVHIGRDRLALPRCNPASAPPRRSQVELRSRPSHAARLSSRDVQAQCIHCLKAAVLQPCFIESDLGSRTAKFLRQTPACKRTRTRHVLIAAEHTSTQGSDHERTPSEDQVTAPSGEHVEAPPTEESAGVQIALSVLKFYKREISPILPPSCRFLPTCSEYSMDSFKTFGVGKGLVLTTWRLLRCNPFGPSGYDPVQWPPPGLEWVFEQDR